MEISKIRCGANGECHNIKDAQSRESIAALERLVADIKLVVEGITGGDVEAFVTEEELLPIIDRINLHITELENAIDSKAEQTALENLSLAVASLTETFTTILADIETKADQTTLESLSDELNTLSSVVDTKVDQTTLESLSNELNTLSTEVDTKADQTALESVSSELNTLSNVVDTKATQTDLSALTTRTTTLEGYDRVSAQGTYYIRFKNGFQICWGNLKTTSVNAITITLPQAFVNTNYSVSTTVVYAGNNWTSEVYVYSRETSKFSCFKYSAVDVPITWIAVGKWK